MKKNIKLIISIALLIIFSISVNAQQRSGVNKYTVGLTYNAGDLVVYQGTIYKASTQTSNIPTNSDWNISSGVFEDKVEALASTILAKNPSSFLGETWFAVDNKLNYKAVTLRGVDVWQAMGLIYDETNDTYKLPTTNDGQTQNVGQEIFKSCYNDNGSGATELNPKVFLITNVKTGEENIKLAVKANSGDLFQGAQYGLNTTSAGVGEYFKLVQFGDVNGVNTSAWLVNTLLYADAVSGELTDVKPPSAIFPIARVDKSHATEGILSVNTISAPEGSTTTIPAGFDRVFYTGDEVVLATGTYFLGKRGDLGTVASATTTAIVDDNQQIPVTQQIVGTPIGFPISFPQGVYTGQIELEINNDSADQRIRIEYYIASADGTPIDSGILSEAVGVLGVRPALRTVSPLFDGPTNTTILAPVQGVLAQDVPLGGTQRVRTVVICEKVGTAGGVITFTVKMGNLHASYTDSPALFEISDNIDVDTGAAITNNFLKLNGSGIWQGSGVVESDITDFGSYVTTNTSQTITGAKTFDSNIVIKSDLNSQGNLKLLNKAGSTYMNWATRNITGTEAVYDLTNLGTATFGGAVSITTDVETALTLESTDAIVRTVFKDNSGEGKIQWQGSTSNFFIDKNLEVALGLNVTGASTFGGLVALNGNASFGTNSSTSGAIRLPNNQIISSRNAANTGNRPLIYLDASDIVQIAPSNQATFGGKVIVDNQLESKSATYPVFKSTRTTSLLDEMRTSVTAHSTTDGDMVDGFGADISFEIEDISGITNEIGNIGAVRDGADNSGKIRFVTAKLGAVADVYTIDSNGAHDFKFGIATFGGLLNANAGLISKGTTSDNTGNSFAAKNSLSASLFTIRNDGRIDASGPFNVTGTATFGDDITISNSKALRFTGSGNKILFDAREALTATNDGALVSIGRDFVKTEIHGNTDILGTLDVTGTLMFGGNGIISTLSNNIDISADSNLNGSGEVRVNASGELVAVFRKTKIDLYKDLESTNGATFGNTVESTGYKISGSTILSGSSTVNLGSGGGTGVINMTTTSGMPLSMAGLNSTFGGQVTVKGASTTDGILELQSNNGATGADQWSLVIDNGTKDFLIKSQTTDVFSLSDSSGNMTVLGTGAFGGQTLSVGSATATSNANINVKTRAADKSQITFMDGNNMNTAIGRSAGSTTMFFQTGGTENMFLNSGGDLAIGGELSVFNNTKVIGTSLNQTGLTLGMVASDDIDVHVAGFGGTSVLSLKETIIESNIAFKAVSLEINGGMSTEFLKADGTTDSNTYLTAASISSDYVKKNERNAYTKQQHFPYVNLTDAASISWDADNQKAFVVLGANRTMLKPSNLQDGATYKIAIQQDDTGSRTVTWSSGYNFGADGIPTLSTGVRQTDILTFESDGIDLFLISIRKGFGGFKYYP